jgi:NitT/TauT family transport system substrate-binding protein
MLSLWMAESNALFAKHRLVVSVVQMAEGPALEALGTGTIDLVIGNGEAALAAAATGNDLRLIAGLVNTYPYRLMVAPSVRTAADLRGTRLGAGRSGSASEAAARYALSELGLAPGTDVTLLQIGAAERPAALENGAIGGAMVAPPDTVALEHAGARTLLDLVALGVEAPSVQVIASARMVREEPVLLQRFVNALLEGTAVAKRDRERALRVLADHVNGDDVALSETYELFVQKLAPRAPYPAITGVRRAQRALSAADPRAAAVDPTTLVYRGFVQQAVETGFVDQLYRPN